MRDCLSDGAVAAFDGDNPAEAVFGLSGPTVVHSTSDSGGRNAIGDAGGGARSIRDAGRPAESVVGFRGRGKSDYLSSHDLEDFVAVLDGRDTILEEIANVPDDLREYLAEAAMGLLEESRFRDVLPGYVLGMKPLNREFVSFSKD